MLEKENLQSQQLMLINLTDNPKILLILRMKTQGKLESSTMRFRIHLKKKRGKLKSITILQ